MNFTKILIFSFFVILLSPLKGVYAEVYDPTDISDHWAESEIRQFVNSSLLEGYETPNGDHEIRPDQSISRAEFVTILNRVLELKKQPSGPDFEDVAGKWYEEQVYIAASNELVNGVGNNKFEPERPITRAEIASVVMRAFKDEINMNEGTVKNFKDVSSDFWAYQTIQQASKVGIINGVSETMFKPNRDASRAEAIVMIKRSLDKEISQLPDKEVLTKFVADYNHDSRAAVDAEDISKFKQMDRRTLGYYKKLHQEATEVYIQWIEDYSLNLEYKVTSEPHFEVIKRSNRFAEVKLTNAFYDLTIIYPTNKKETYKRTENGEYLLHKTEGQWKLYDLKFDKDWK
ncbi:S-layer homology domain-containing protein [Halobacillus yeomjeoni]|uniref:S-layer homology domain-containing protein n=1 Tax=Halobacillus yeomjeoni TaxID=311194 RepID=UPI001CD52046|nr:S-layer homology domain-containing protein [Halobacillus yeomjeoni]MCA0983477.1 S-layer homology domain-containing protein [Halobacillus yeomjeoni]